MKNVILRSKYSAHGIDLLKKETANNPAFAAICKMLSKRQRARRNITIKGLQFAMEKSGHKFEPMDYARALQIFSEAHVGTLRKDDAGNIVSLENVKIKLQSVGKNAMGETTKYETMGSKTNNKHFAMPAANADAPREVAAKQPIEAVQSYLTILVNGVPLKFTGPKDIKIDELSEFLQKFTKLTDKGV